MRLIKGYLIAILLVFWASCVLAVSFNVPPNDSVYNLLEELEAKGVIQSQIWGIKPFSQEEVLRLLNEALQNKEKLPGYLQLRLSQALNRFKTKAGSDSKSYFKPLEDPYFLFIYSSKERPWENLQGRDQGKSSFFLGFQSKFYYSEHLIFHSILEASRVSDQEDFNRLKFLALYSKIGGRKWSFLIGKDQIWWGQADTGNILFSLNTPPFAKLLKLESEESILLPSFLRILGPFKFSLFAAKLEKDRHVPEPWLFGMKVAFKPHPKLEIDLSRSIMAGGKGRDLSFKKIVFGIGENIDVGTDPAEGDQKAGIEVRFRPLSGLVTYLEAYGEDEAGGLPSRWSYILGTYLVDFLPKTNFRFEYANITRWWYHHHVYRSGYTYKGWLIGYYTDRTVKNYFFDISYNYSSDFKLTLSYWYEKHFNTRNQYLYRISRYQFGLEKQLVLKKLRLQLDFKYRFNNFSLKDIEDDHQLYFFIKLPY